MSQDASITQVFLAGYCWGGHVATKVAADESISVLAGIFTAHGGQLKIPEDYQLIRKPACIVIAGLDFEHTPPKQQIIKETMAKLKESHNVPNDVHVIEGAFKGAVLLPWPFSTSCLNSPPLPPTTPYSPLVVQARSTALLCVETRQIPLCGKSAYRPSSSS